MDGIAHQTQPVRLVVLLAVGFIGGYLAGDGKRWGGNRVEGKNDSMLADGVAEGTATNSLPRDSQFGETDREPWTRERLQSAVRALLKSGDDLANIRPILYLADQMEAGDFPAALEVAKEVPGGEEGYMYRRLMLARWSELKPQAVADYLLSQNKSILEQKGDMSVLILVWARTDPEAAAAWARGIDNPFRQRDVLEGIVECVARRDPNRALAFAQTHTPSLFENGGFPDPLALIWRRRSPKEAAHLLAETNQPGELSRACYDWAEKDRVGALTWAQELSEPKQREAAMAGVYLMWRDKDVAAAAASYAQLEAPTTERLQDIGAEIVQGWAHQNGKPADVQAWVETLPTGPAKDNATERVVDYFSRDRQALETWLETLPAGPGRDNAMAQYVLKLQDGDRMGAVARILKIGEPAKRAQTFRTIAQDWFKKDPVGTADWMQNDVGMPSAEKRKLLQER